MTRLITRLVVTTALFGAIGHASAALVNLNLTGTGVSGTLIIDTSASDSNPNADTGIYNGAFSIDNLSIGGNSYSGSFILNSITLENNTVGGTTDIITFNGSGGTFGGSIVDAFDLVFEDDTGTLLSSDALTQLENISLLNFGTGELFITDENSNTVGEARVQVGNGGNPIPVPGALLLGIIGLAALGIRRR